MNLALSPSTSRRLALALLLVLLAGVLVLRMTGTPSSALPDRVLGVAQGAPDGLDGAVGDLSLTIDDHRHPAISGLDPALRDAVATANAAAARDGIQVRITSGWRSEGYQERLLERAIREYGSEQEARRWVATPLTSAHVRGDAVDVGPTDAAYWMQQHGSDFGLCQVFANEVWHYELLTTPGGSCPPMRTDGAS